MGIEKIVLEANEFKEFNPMQQKVLEKNWRHKNLLVCAPTASGKTIVAELTALESILTNKRKVIYTCPLRALAREHFEDFKKKYSKKLGTRIALSTGDFDSSSKYLSRYDLVFCTYEKLDSLIRHNAEWLSGVGLLVVDEIHELDSTRGATLEVVITKFRLLNKKCRTVSLSATVPNPKDIAKWLNAQLIESDYRPVKLKEGTYFDKTFKYINEKEGCKSSLDEPLHCIIDDTVNARKKQALIFASTRKNAQSTAKKLQKTVGKTLLEKEKDFLFKKSLQILNALEQPTEQCVALSELVKGGVAFHHAGLVQKQRSIVEELFKSGYLKALAATPTLAAGVNLPAHTVAVSSVYRYGGHGSERLPVREVKQMLGRSGRPAYDEEGRGIIVARSEVDADFLFDNYVLGELEPIESKLGIEPILRMHLLSAVASDFVFDLESLEKFFSKTLYFHQFGKSKEFFMKIFELIGDLEKMGFIESDDKKIAATKIGKRVSELYLDPFSAYTIINSLKNPKKPAAFSYLFLLTDCGEFYPLISLPRSRQALFWEELQERSSELLFSLEEKMLEDPDLLKKYFTALLLQQWIDEKSSQDILKQFNVLPGILHSKVERSDWLVYSVAELARLLELKHHLVPLQKLRKRLKYGVREELLGLCGLKGIGRVRARRLFRAGITKLSVLRKVDSQKLSSILGSELAKSVKKQLGGGLLQAL